MAASSCVGCCRMKIASSFGYYADEILKLCAIHSLPDFLRCHDAQSETASRRKAKACSHSCSVSHGQKGRLTKIVVALDRLWTLPLSGTCELRSGVRELLTGRGSFLDIRLPARAASTASCGVSAPEANLDVPAHYITIAWGTRHWWDISSDARHLCENVSSRRGDAEASSRPHRHSVGESQLIQRTGEDLRQSIPGQSSCHQMYWDLHQEQRGSRPPGLDHQWHWHEAPHSYLLESKLVQPCEQ